MSAKDIVLAAGILDLIGNTGQSIGAGVGGPAAVGLTIANGVLDLVAAVMIAAGTEVPIEIAEARDALKAKAKADELANAQLKEELGLDMTATAQETPRAKAGGIVIPIFTPGIKEAMRLVEAVRAVAEAARGKLDDALVSELADALAVAMGVLS